MTKPSVTRNAVIVLMLCVFVLAVSASVTEKLLRVPLFDVGQLWLKSFQTFIDRVYYTITTCPDFYSWTTYLWIALLCVSCYYIHLIFFAKLNRVRVLGDLGYVSDGKFTMKEVANDVRKRRKVGDIPPVYPNGWFGLMESHSLKVGESKYLSVLGLHLAVFRGENGESHVVDAYCPHMGANLAVGGRVVGNCLECPFHGWQFRGYDGKCTKIPYAEKIPSLAKVKSYITSETNGWIYLWHHAEGSEPTWNIPEIEEINKGEWTFRGRTEHFINAHIEEIPENGADISHLHQVHSPILSAGIDLRYMWNKFWSFGQHRWTAAWEQNPAPEQHIGTLKLTHNLRLFGKSLTPVEMDVNARQIGPGIVYMDIDTFFGKGVFMMSLTPVEPMIQKMVHNIYIQRKCPTVLAKFFMIAEAIMVERDIMIWNNKQYEGKPMYVKSKEDSLIAKHRRWYAQFYSENSPKLTFQKQTMDW